MAKIGLFLLFSLCATHTVHGRVWNDTGVGSIVFEEAWTTAELIHQSEYANFYPR